MSYALQQKDPRKQLIGLGAVILFHALLIYGLANGLARKVVDVIKGPLDVAVIQEVKPPPPPPKVVQQLPKTVAPPPAYVPPVEVPVQAPPPVIATTSNPAPPPPATPTAPAAPQAVNIAVACPNFRNFPPQMPPQAERQGLSGDVVVEFTVAASGEVRDVSVIRSTNALFNAAAVKAVSQYRCVSQGRDVRVKQPISFRVDG